MRISAFVPLLLISFFARSVYSDPTVEPVGFEDNKVLVSVSEKCAVTIVRYVKERKYADRNTTSGTIFWKRERMEFPEAGRYGLEMDLSSAEAGTPYVVFIVVHDIGAKYRLECMIENGKFKAKD